MIRKIGESFPILANFHANETPLSGGGETLGQHATSTGEQGHSIIHISPL